MAVGRIGLSVQEFCLLTPAEFNAIYEEWKSEQEDITRGQWERCREICYHIIRPYAKKTLRKTDIMRFAWDSPSSNGTKKLTEEQKEANRKKFEELKELWK